MFGLAHYSEVKAYVQPNPSISFVANWLCITALMTICQGVISRYNQEQGRQTNGSQETMFASRFGSNPAG
jgi:hypothetical protein